MKILGYRIVEYLTTCDKCNTVLCFDEEDKVRGGLFNLSHGFICPTCGKFLHESLCVMHTAKQAPPLEDQDGNNRI